MKKVFTAIICAIIILIVGNYIYGEKEVAARDLITLKTIEGDIENLDDFFIRGIVQSTKNKGQEFTKNKDQISTNIVPIDRLSCSTKEVLENKDFYRGTARHTRFFDKNTRVLVGMNNKKNKTTLDIRYNDSKDGEMIFKREYIDKVEGEIEGSIIDKLPQLFFINMFKYEDEIYFVGSIRSDYDKNSMSYMNYSLILFRVDFENKALDAKCVIGKLSEFSDYYHDVFLMNKNKIEEQGKLQILSLVNFCALAEKKAEDKYADVTRYTVDLNNYNVTTTTKIIKDTDVDFPIDELLKNGYNSYGCLEKDNKFYIFYDNYKSKNETVSFTMDLNDNSLDIRKDPNILSKEFTDISIIKVLKKDDKWCLLFVDLTKQEPFRDYYVCILDENSQSKLYMGKVSIEKNRNGLFGIDIEEKIS